MTLRRRVGKWSPFAVVALLLLGGCSTGQSSAPNGASTAFYTPRMVGQCAERPLAVGEEADVVVAIANRTSHYWRQTWATIDAGDFSVGQLTSTLRAPRDAGDHVYALGRLGLGGHLRLVVPLLARHVAFATVKVSAWGTNVPGFDPVFPGASQTLTCRYTIR